MDERQLGKCYSFEKGPARFLTTPPKPQALSDVFLHGLCEEVKDELAAWDLPLEFDELVVLTIRIDKSIQQPRDEQTSYETWLHPKRCQSPPVIRRLQVGNTSFPRSLSARTVLSSFILVRGQRHTILVLIDSEAEGNFISSELASTFGLQLSRLSLALEARDIMGRRLALITHVTEPVSFLISGNQQERIVFNVLDSFVLVFLDDLSIFFRSQSEHVQHVNFVPQWLLENKPFVKA